MGFVTLTLCVMLWAHDGAERELAAYEDAVLGLLGDHGARVISRARTLAVERGDPVEVQLLEFPSENALADFMVDERRAALADQREAAVARTQLLRVELT